VDVFDVSLMLKTSMKHLCIIRRQDFETHKQLIKNLGSKDFSIFLKEVSLTKPKIQ